MLLDLTREPIFIDPGSCQDGLAIVVTENGPPTVPYGARIPGEGHPKLSPLGRNLKPVDDIGGTRAACPVFDLRPSTSSGEHNLVTVFEAISANGLKPSESELGYRFWAIHLHCSFKSWGCTITRRTPPEYSIKMHLPDYRPDFVMDLKATKQYKTAWDRIADSEDLIG